MGHRQKGKHHKRKKSWHRGRGEARRFLEAMKRMGEPVQGVKVRVKRRG